jgi:hypothetical protein
MSVTDRSALAASAVATPELWREMTAAIASMERIVYEDPRVVDDLTKAEGIRYLTRLIAGGIALTLEGWDWRHPRLIKFLSTGVQFGLPAADCHYQTAAVHGDHTYRITGTRGSSRMFDVETRKGFMARLGDWSLIDRRSEFEVGADGLIEVVLSREEHPGNWVRLADGPGSIIVRQYYYDWIDEQPAVLRIDRDGAEYPATPVTVGAIEERMRFRRRCSTPSAATTTLRPMVSSTARSITAGPISSTARRRMHSSPDRRRSSSSARPRLRTGVSSSAATTGKRGIGTCARARSTATRRHSTAMEHSAP